ncbi:MAG: hypothetical protein EOS79_29120 [Mesorhizobium sp.]|uniref:alpha-hydroxy-acid oxidizing protein n=1 Tax=Mesorhizobium sp. TaxID=1871066 RepID=UPI000FE460A8|nr:MAG: hypothetical protein EOS79_29120 [Mesorhizobium sp.]
MRLSRKRDRRRAGARAQPRRARRDHARTALNARYQRPLDRAALFGGDYNLPIGISPVGLVNALWPGADNMLAAAARAANVPYGLSTVGTTSIEASGGYWAGCRQSGFRRPPCESCRDRWVMTHDRYRPIPGR